ncbi:MAG: amino acid permease [Bacteroidetes bacterium CHB5]|nr:amino acid permease [Bacteroidetes bacterium CHB5]
MIVVSLVIGMGIFRTPVEVANKAQLPEIFFVAWIVGALISFFGALTFAEIGSRYPVAGGFYRIFSHCYHPSFAFMVNWMTVISNAASTASVAIIGAEYIQPILFPQMEPTTAIRIITLSAMITLYGINMAGIKMSARMLNVLMIIKISLIVLLIVAIVAAPKPVDAPVELTPLTTTDWLKAFWLCFVPVFFTYGGYQQTMNFGSDIPNAARTMPRAIFYGIAIILSLYLLVNFSYFKVLGFEGLKNSTTLAADVARVLLGDYAFKVVAVIMFLSVMAYVNASIMSNPRVYYAMAEDKVLPPVFKKVNSKTQVQEFAVSVFVGFIVLTLFFSASFTQVLSYVMFFDSISLVTASAAIFILRYRAKKQGDPVGIYKMIGYPWMPALFIVVYTLVNISVLVSNPQASLIGFVLFLSGYPLYRILVKLIN